MAGFHRHPRWSRLLQWIVLRRTPSSIAVVIVHIIYSFVSVQAVVDAYERAHNRLGTGIVRAVRPESALGTQRRGGVDSLAHVEYNGRRRNRNETEAATESERCNACPFCASRPSQLPSVHNGASSELQG